MAYYTAIKNYILKKVLRTLGKFSNYQLKCKHRPQNPYSMYSQHEYVICMKNEPGRKAGSRDLCLRPPHVSAANIHGCPFAGLKLNSI